MKKRSPGKGIPGTKRLVCLLIMLELVVSLFGHTHKICLYKYKRVNLEKQRNAPYIFENKYA